MAERFSFRYYLLGQSVPIRVSIDQRGREAGAEVPDMRTGTLVYQNQYLSRLLVSPEVEEIDSQEFWRRCEEIAQHLNGRR